LHVPRDRPIYFGGSGAFGGPVDDEERTTSVHGDDDLDDDADDANH